jgi:hypothetical protein
MTILWGNFSSINNLYLPFYFFLVLHSRLLALQIWLVVWLVITPFLHVNFKYKEFDNYLERLLICLSFVCILF